MRAATLKNLPNSSRAVPESVPPARSDAERKMIQGTPFAAQLAAGNAAQLAQEHGVRTLDVRVQGPGAGRESAIRALAAAGLDIRSIRDATPIPKGFGRSAP